jgi:hypothetical protein
VEHFYRAVQRAYIGDDEWEQLSVTLRRGLVRQAFRRTFAEAAEAGRGGGFDRAGTHLDRLPLCLDEQGHAELSAALTALLEQALAIQARVDERNGLPRGGDQAGAASEQSAASILVLMHFDEAPSSIGPATESRPPPSHQPPLLR